MKITEMFVKAFRTWLPQVGSDGNDSEDVA